LGVIGAAAGQARPVWLLCLVPGAIALVMHPGMRRWSLRGRHLLRRELRRGRYLAALGTAVAVLAGWQALLLRDHLSGPGHDAPPSATAAARPAEDPDYDVAPALDGPAVTDRGRPVRRYDVVNVAAHAAWVAHEERRAIEQCQGQGPFMRTVPIDAT